jgi:hypothetical protein
MILAGPLICLTLLGGSGAPGVSPAESVPAASVLTTDPSIAPLWGALQSEEHPDRLWTWGWASFLGAVAVGQTAIAASTTNEGTKINAYVNVPASAVGMLAILLAPPAAAFGLDDIRRMPEDTEAQREAKASAARALFNRSVEQQRFYRSPLNHAIGLTVNAGLSALLYFGWKLGGRALLMLVAGTIQWEAQIFTRPTAALDLASARGGTVFKGLQIIPLPNGIAVAGTF